MEQNTALFDDITEFGRNYLINGNQDFQTLKDKRKKTRKKEIDFSKIGKTITEAEFKNPMVEFHNDLNSIVFTAFNEIDFNIFFALCFIFKNRLDKTLSLTFEEVRLLVELNDNHKTTNRNRFYESLVSFSNKLMSLKAQGYKSVGINKKRKYSVINFFSVIDIDEDSKTFFVKISEEASCLINNLFKNYTRFDLKEFCSIDSKYAKNLYRILKQYENLGHCKLDWESFRNIMCIPESYEHRNINQKILNPSISKLNSNNYNGIPYFKDLTYQKIKVSGKGRGGVVSAIVFEFVPKNKALINARNKQILNTEVTPPPMNSGGDNKQVMIGFW
ncbi:replication initiation protein [Helicobacter winghamensis]|uniref:replication initiation protein n=1 Tax=Helicobacter winghamensis TaxID=157268 RepID=UPI0027A49C49